MKIYSKNAFTLIEIMIVVVIIGLIFAIGLPNYFKMVTTSKKNVCINNLKQIDMAVSQWAIDNNIPIGAVPSEEQENTVYTYIKGQRPVCPEAGTYTIYQVGIKPQVRCSREDAGHKLPD